MSATNHQVQLVAAPLAVKNPTAPPCVAWVCASSTASASCRIPCGARNDQQDQLPGQVSERFNDGTQ